VFLQKRLQPVENTGRGRRKEGKETPKRRQTAENMGFATEAQSENWECAPPPPRGFCIDEKTKGLRKEGFVTC
jgi:hypothetical protein